MNFLTVIKAAFVSVYVFFSSMFGGSPQGTTQITPTPIPPTPTPEVIEVPQPETPTPTSIPTKKPTRKPTTVSTQSSGAAIATPTATDSQSTTAPIPSETAELSAPGGPLKKDDHIKFSVNANYALSWCRFKMIRSGDGEQIDAGEMSVDGNSCSGVIVVRPANFKLEVIISPNPAGVSLSRDYTVNY